MRDTLNNKITSIISKNKDVNKQANLSNPLKEKSLNDTQLPKGVSTNAASFSHCKPSLITSYFDHNLIARNNIVWNNLVSKENFDKIKAFILVTTSNSSGTLVPESA